MYFFVSTLGAAIAEGYSLFQSGRPLFIWGHSGLSQARIVLLVLCVRTLTVGVLFAGLLMG